VAEEEFMRALIASTPFGESSWAIVNSGLHRRTLKRRMAYFVARTGMRAHSSDQRSVVGAPRSVSIYRGWDRLGFLYDKTRAITRAGGACLLQ
jgi:hypothetical protein